MTDYEALSAAATAAPWEDDGVGVWHGDTLVLNKAADRALIVALRNGIADGSLVPRERVDALVAAAKAALDYLGERPHPFGDEVVKNLLAIIEKSGAS